MLTVFVSGGDASQGDIGVHSCGDGSRAMLVPTATLTTKVGPIHGFSMDPGELVGAWCAFLRWHVACQSKAFMEIEPAQRRLRVHLLGDA